MGRRPPAAPGQCGRRPGRWRRRSATSLPRRRHDRTVQSGRVDVRDHGVACRLQRALNRRQILADGGDFPPIGPRRNRREQCRGGTHGDQEIPDHPSHAQALCLNGAPTADSVSRIAIFLRPQYTPANLIAGYASGPARGRVVEVSRPRLRQRPPPRWYGAAYRRNGRAADNHQSAAADAFASGSAGLQALPPDPTTHSYRTAAHTIGEIFSVSSRTPFPTWIGRGAGAAPNPSAPAWCQRRAGAYPRRRNIAGPHRPAAGVRVVGVRHRRHDRQRGRRHAARRCGLRCGQPSSGDSAARGRASESPRTADAMPG